MNKITMVFILMTITLPAIMHSSGVANPSVNPSNGIEFVSRCTIDNNLYIHLLLSAQFIKDGVTLSKVTGSTVHLLSEQEKTELELPGIANLNKAIMAHRKGDMIATMMIPSKP